MTTDATTGEVIETTTEDDHSALLELERTRIALKAANKESAERRKRLEELEKAETERTSAAMTELDKANKRAEEAEAKALKAEERAQQTLIRAAFVSEAAKAGASYPEDVYRLADLAGVDVTEDGKVTGVAESVKALVDAGRIPLAGKTPAPNLDGGAGGSDRSHGSTVKLTQAEVETAKRMGITPEKYALQKAAIKASQEE